MKVGPIKIYCILIDAMPLTNKILSIAQSSNAQILSQMGSCFTNNSCIEMLTGKMPSDLREHGMGHLCHKKYRDEKNNINWPWQKELLLEQLYDRDWEIIYHDGRHYADVLSNNKGFKKTFCEGYKDDNCLLGYKSGSKLLRENEVKNIKKIQSYKIKRNLFYFVRYTYFHRALDIGDKKGRKKGSQKEEIALKRIYDLLKKWDFAEPNSFFWFFSDHGRWNSPYDFKHPNPCNYLSWVLIKDNTEKPIKIRSRHISIRDFYPIIMNKFNYFYEEISDIKGIEREQDEDRIYYIEDGRKNINDDISTTAIACQFVDWQKNKPQGILQVSYHSVDKSWKCRYTGLDRNGFYLKTKEEKIIDKKLQVSVKKRFKWVK